jgi:hypothetical protein
MADLRGMPADLSRFYPPPLTLSQLWDLGVSGLDADEPDPLDGVYRLLEQLPESWLSFSEAVELLREREPMSVGQAEAIIDDLRLAYYADGGPFARQSGKTPAVRYVWFYGVELPNRPHRGNSFVSEADLIYWHDRNRDIANNNRQQQSTSPPASDPTPAEVPEGDHTSPTVDRANIAINALYPQGVPTQATLRNKRLIADVNGELARMGLKAVSETTVLRAAGRRKK